MYKVNRTENSAIHFSTTNPTPVEVLAQLYDVNSKTLMWSTKMLLQPGASYFVSGGPMGDCHAKTIEFRIVNPSSLDIEFVHTFINTSENVETKTPVIKGKPVYFKADKDDHTFHTVVEVFYHKDYEKSFTQVDVGDVIVDIGANVGVFSVYAQRFNPKKVYALEPVPDTFNYLVENTKNYSNVIPINMAIAENSGKEFITVTTHSGCNVLVKTGLEFADEVEKIEIDTININEFIKQHKITHIDFLKVDCEGGELDLFRTIDRDYLTNNIKKIAMEYHSSSIRAEIITTLKLHGFTIEVASPSWKETGMIYAYKAK